MISPINKTFFPSNVPVFSAMEKASSNACVGCSLIPSPALMMAGPPTLIPTYIKDALGVLVEYNLKKALQWCDVANVLRIQLERQNQVLFSSLREYNLAYGVTKKILDEVNKEIIIMHPGPINRGVEIDSDVADSNRSIILQQVEYGVAVRMAVLYLLAGKKGE